MSSSAELLNRECACISVDRSALQALLDRGEGMGGLYDSILAKQPHLFASVPVFLGRKHVDAMLSVIDAGANDEFPYARGRLRAGAHGDHLS